VPQAAVRLYGGLLLKSEQVRLGCIAVDLEIGKTSASVAARLVEQYALVRRAGEVAASGLVRGIRQLRWLLTEQNRLLEALAELLRTGAGNVASGKRRERLKEIAEFKLVMREAMGWVLRRWRENVTGAIPNRNPVAWLPRKSPSTRRSLDRRNFRQR
jgi:hypothetical protein